MPSIVVRSSGRRGWTSSSAREQLGDGIAPMVFGQWILPARRHPVPSASSSACGIRHVPKQGRQRRRDPGLVGLDHVASPA